MPWKPSPVSNWWTDVTLPAPFDRVRIDAFADSERECRDREALLRKLYRKGQFETIRALLAKGEGRVLFPEVVAADREGRLDNDGLLADLRMRGPLWDSLEAAFKDHERNTQEERYYFAAKKLEKVACNQLGLIKPKARVRDLAKAKWEELFDAWPDSDSDYMHVRRMVSAYLTRLFKDPHHPGRRAIMAVIPSVTVPPRSSELSFDRWLAIMDHVRVDVRASLWTMAITALRSGEFLACGPEHKRADLHVIEVPIRPRRRSKAGQAKVKHVAVHPDLWHVVEEGIPSRYQYDGLRTHFKTACRAAGYPTIRLHDIRHLSAHLGFTGGASVPDVQTLMRHARPEQTLDYAQLQHSREAAASIAKVVSRSLKRRGA